MVHGLNSLLRNRLKSLWRKWICKVLDCMCTLCCMWNVDRPIEHINFSIIKGIHWLCVNNSIWCCIIPFYPQLSTSQSHVCVVQEISGLYWLIAQLVNIRSGQRTWIVQFYNLFTAFHFHFSLPHLKIASYTTSVAVCLDPKPILWHCRVLHAHSQLLRMPGRRAAVHINGIFQKGEGLQTLAGPPRLLLHKDFCPLGTLEGKKLHEICSSSAGSNHSSCQA